MGLPWWLSGKEYVCNAAYGHAKSLQLCPTLCNPMDSPGSSVHGILQARILEWAAIPLQEIFLTPGSDLCLLSLLHWHGVLYH